jgi:hypothetical protein
LHRVSKLSMYFYSFILFIYSDRVRTYHR